MKKIVALTLAVLLMSLWAGCGGGDPKLPLPALIASLKDLPTFSIILADMKKEGNFFDSYYQKFKIVAPKDQPAAKPKANDGNGLAYTPPAVSTRQTDWMQVPERWYKENQRFLGMTIYAKKEGVVQKVAGPPGYEYVGDSRYGRWTSDSRGNQIWSFFGQYAMLSMLLGNRGVYQQDYRNYRTYQTRGTTYYGPRDNRGRTTYGTSGSVTQRQSPNFFARRMAAQRSASSSFSRKVSSRTGRSSVSVRGRSGRGGK